MTTTFASRRATSIVALLLGTALTHPAQALPSLAAQTGQPCVACHIGAFGPQLTPFGREFKIGGYTAQGGDGLASQIPISGMVLGSFNNTSSSYPTGSQPQHYGTNNNPALDQISLFLAGRLGDNSGALIQTTYTDVDNSFHLDQVDIRPYTDVAEIDGNDLRWGTTITNAPTVQDPFNSTFAWGYPYVASVLAPTPAAAPMLVGGFVGNSLGLTAYAYYDHRIYLEAGGYQSMSPWLLARAGTALGAGQIDGVAPYLRAAYVWDWDNQTAHVGALFMQANTFPAGGNGRSATTSGGTDSYTDFAVDAGYQFDGDLSRSYSLEGIYVNESQALKATAAGSGYGSNYSLNTIHLAGTYWIENTYGASLGWQRTWGSANPLLYNPSPIGGSNNSRPDTNAFILEADWVPFGKEESWFAPFANLKFGLQYTIYTQFNGGNHNYDGYGRNASGNNTLYAFAWTMF